MIQPAGIDHNLSSAMEVSDGVSNVPRLPENGKSSEPQPRLQQTSFQPLPHIETHNRAYESCVPHDIKGLFSSFHTAVTILRIARELGELDESLAENRDSSVVSAFYNRLKIVERHLYEKPKYPPFVVLVEGLDGSGKSTLVKRLAADAQTHPQQTLATLMGRAMSAPTASMAAVRDVFDHRGGIVARAFYMVSNYMLQHEIREECNENPQTIFVVDRWFASTCAYSVAWKNTSGGPESIDNLDDSLFEWPKDLVPPDILLLLNVDVAIRRDRVQARRLQLLGSGEANQHNPWDDRLDQDEHLGRRIFRAFERLKGPREVIRLDANQTQEQVVQDALAIVHDRSHRHFFPLDYFQQLPLEFLRWISAKLGLCDAETGKHSENSSWSMQLSRHCSSTIDAPFLTTVGIHTLDASGILFFNSKAEACDGDGNVNDPKQMFASAAWVGGGQQWRAEGILCAATLEECRIMKQLLPSSLVAHFVACCLEHKEEESKKDSDASTARNCSCLDLPPNYAVEVVSASSLPEEASQCISATRFVPLRMEVLICEPSAADGPQRWEWQRGSRFEGNGNGWSSARAIVPFWSPEPLTYPSFVTSSLLPVTLVLTGTHCSGKATLGKKLAQVLGWSFDGELGEELRSDNLAQGGHRLGDGSGSSNASSWDQLVHKSETLRDQQSKTCRVVETWHMGNLAWALLRIHALTESDRLLPKEELVRWARHSIQAEMQKSIVLWVHISVGLSTVLRRRKADPVCSNRVPLANEIADCQEMQTLLEERNVQDELMMSGIPRVVLDNNVDGDQAIDNKVREIVTFLHLQQWRRGISV